MSKSTRRLTLQQFSSGTTIDGNRLDRAFDDVVSRANAIRDLDMARRHMQSQIVLGWIPAVTNAQDTLPFMLEQNYSSELVGTPPTDGFQNEFRVKGTANSGLDTASGYGALVWTTSMYFTKPIILDGVSLHFRVDGQYTNTLTFSGGTPPAGKTADAPLDDIVISVAIDNPYAQELAQFDNLEIHKTQFKVDAVPYSTLAVPFGTFDGSPAHPFGAFNGLAIDERHLAIPIPRNSRLRLAITIPKYPAAKTSGWTEGPSGVVFPWQNQVISSALTLLEAIDE